MFTPNITTIQEVSFNSKNSRKYCFISTTMYKFKKKTNMAWFGIADPHADIGLLILMTNLTWKRGADTHSLPL